MSKHSEYKTTAKRGSLHNKIQMVCMEKPRSWSAAEMLQELVDRNWVNEWVNVLDIAEVMKEMYGAPQRG